jgi:heavy metal sensor kinase
MTKRVIKPFRERVGAFIRSIRFRIVLWFTLILAIILCLLSTFLYITQSRNIQDEAVRDLQGRMSGLATLVQNALRQGTNQISIPNGLLRSTDVLILIGPNGQVLTSQGPVPAQTAIQVVSAGLRLSSHISEGSPVYWTDSNSQNYLFLTTAVQGPLDINVIMIYGGILDPTALVRRFLLTLVGGSLLTLLIALLGGLWLADRAMRPVKTITQAARSISETDLSRRLNMKSKDELGELANTFDGMLSRLQAAFERQRQFVADASHELRTPLTIVNLETSRVLASKRSQPEYQHALQVIHSENDFMTGLVNNLLMLARMDAGQASLEKTRLDLSDLVVDTLERFTPLASRNGVTLQAGDLPEACIQGDRQYLLQMLGNLVENGIKYVDGNEKKVVVETGVADGTAWVHVTDTGPGIAPENIPHLFDRFYRVDKARTRSTETDGDSDQPNGSGLGLSIVHWIVQAHGGEIHVDSTPGSGTTFEVRFKSS